MLAKIKLVVVNENTLGCVFPEMPNSVQVLRASVLGGSNWHDCENYNISGPSTTVRLASEKDFNDYNVIFKGFDNSIEYEFLTSNF